MFSAVRMLGFYDVIFNSKLDHSVAVCYNDVCMLHLSLG